MSSQGRHGGRIAQYSRHSTYDTTPPPPHKTPSGVDRKCPSSVEMLCSWRRLGRHIRLNLMNARGGRAKFLFIPLRPELAGFAMRKPYTIQPPPGRIAARSRGYANAIWDGRQIPGECTSILELISRRGRARALVGVASHALNLPSSRRARSNRGPYGDCLDKIDFI